MEKKQWFEPNESQVLVLLPIVARKTDSGIIKSEQAIMEEEAALKGDSLLEIKAVGENCKYKVGDKVYISSTQLPTITIDGVTYGLAHQGSIMGKEIFI